MLNIVLGTFCATQSPWFLGQVGHDLIKWMIAQKKTGLANIFAELVLELYRWACLPAYLQMGDLLLLFSPKTFADTQA